MTNNYIDLDDKITEDYHADLENNTLAPLPDSIKDMTEGIHNLIQGIFDESVFDKMIENAHDTKVKENPLNDNFHKQEFQALWSKINHKYAYRVEFDSNELIDKAVDSINQNLYVSQLQYTASVGQQKADISADEINSGSSFSVAKTRTQTLKHAESSKVPYDLIGKISEGTVLTRRTAAAILSRLDNDKLYMFRYNPEEFISKVIKLIREQKATMIVDHITYNQIDGCYSNDIFTADKNSQPFDKAFVAKKAIQDYVFTDGYAKDGQSIERKFVSDLDTAEEVVVYAKLPKGFHIPTPVGNYSPDWAIAFKEGSVKHIYFIAETKGAMESMQFKRIENAKIDCARKLFNNISTSEVRYDVVNDYQKLLGVVNGK